MPNDNTIIGTSKPSDGEMTLAAEDNRIKQDVVLRRYMAASSIAQKQMIEKGELAKELYEAGPGGNGKIRDLQKKTNSPHDLDTPDGYKQFVDDVVIPKCNDYHEKGYDENNNKWASDIARESYNNLKEQGFYNKNAYMGGETTNVRGEAIRGSDKSRLKGLQNAGQGNISSKTNTFGDNFTIDPETRAVTARPTGISNPATPSGKIFNSRKQAKSAFQGLIAAGHMGKPLIFTLDTTDEKLARDQIRQLTEEAVARKVPLDQITIETPGLPNTEPRELDKIVTDAASNAKSQYEQQNTLRTGMLGVRAAGFSALGKTWGNDIVDKGGLDSDRKDKYLNGGSYDKSVEPGAPDPNSVVDMYLDDRNSETSQTSESDPEKKHEKDVQAIKDSVDYANDLVKKNQLNNQTNNTPSASDAGNDDEKKEEPQPQESVLKAAGGGGETTKPNDEPKDEPKDDTDCVKTFKQIEPKNPKEKAKLDAQNKKDKKLIKKDIAKQRNIYKQLKNKFDKLEKEQKALSKEASQLHNAKVRAKNAGKDRVTVGFSSMTIEEAEAKIAKLDAEVWDLGVEKSEVGRDLEEQAVKCLESYNLYKVLDGKENEQILCKKGLAVNVMDRTLESYSPMANVGSDKNIRNIEQSARSERDHQLETLGTRAVKQGDIVMTLLDQKRLGKALSPDGSRLNDRGLRR